MIIILNYPQQCNLCCANGCSPAPDGVISSAVFPYKSTVKQMLHGAFLLIY